MEEFYYKSVCNLKKRLKEVVRIAPLTFPKSHILRSMFASTIAPFYIEFHCKSKLEIFYREQIVRSAAPKVDSGHVAHVSHRPEFTDRQFHQTISGELVTSQIEPNDKVKTPKPSEDDPTLGFHRSHTVPDDMLLADFEDLDLEDLQNDIIFTKEYFDALDSPMRQSLLKLKERKMKEKYAFKEKNVQRVRTREYLHKQLTRTNYISSSLSVLMASGDQTTFERDLTWKTARKIEILRNKSRSTPLVPYGILYPRIGGITRFQGRPTKGEISLIERRVGNMSKNMVDSKETLKAWKDAEGIETSLPNEDDNSRNLSALDILSPEERRQIAEDEAKISRMKTSFEKLPNIDKRTAEILARTITEEERKEVAFSSGQLENFGVNNESRFEARRGKAPTGVLYKSNLAQRNKTTKEQSAESNQFGLGRVNGPPRDLKKLGARKPPKMKPVFPPKDKPLKTFDPSESVTTPESSKRETRDDQPETNKVFITQPREISNLGKEELSLDDEKTRALSSSGRKSVSFDENVEQKTFEDLNVSQTEKIEKDFNSEASILHEINSVSESERDDTKELRTEDELNESSGDQNQPNEEQNHNLDSQIKIDKNSDVHNSSNNDDEFPNREINKEAQDTNQSETREHDDVTNDDVPGNVEEADKEIQASFPDEDMGENYLQTIRESSHE